MLDIDRALSRVGSSFCLIACFLVVGIPIANVLGKRDEEPELATLSLWLLCMLGATVAVVSYNITLSVIRRSAHRINASLTGIAASVAYFIPLGFVQRGLGLVAALVMGLLAIVLLASMIPAATLPKGHKL